MAKQDRHLHRPQAERKPEPLPFRRLVPARILYRDPEEAWPLDGSKPEPFAPGAASFSLPALERLLAGAH